MADTFYRWFSDRQKELTGFGRSRRARTERSRLGHVMRHKSTPGDFLEVGPGHGTLAEQAVAAGWRYPAIEAGPILVDVLRRKGLAVIEWWAPPIPIGDSTADVLYADQVLEHMPGIDAAREFIAEAHRALRAGRRLLRRRARLSEGARLLLGRRLHAQLRDHGAARAAAVV